MGPDAAKIPRLTERYSGLSDLVVVITGAKSSVMLAVNGGVGHNHRESAAFSQVELTCSHDKQGGKVMVRRQLRARRPESSTFTHRAKNLLHVRRHETVGKPWGVANDHVHAIAVFR